METGICVFFLTGKIELSHSDWELHRDGTAISANNRPGSEIIFWTNFGLGNRIHTPSLQNPFAVKNTFEVRVLVKYRFKVEMKLPAIKQKQFGQTSQWNSTIFP